MGSDEGVDRPDAAKTGDTTVPDDSNGEEGAAENTPLATVFEGAGIVFGGRVIKLVVGFLVQLLVARVLGTTGYGSLSLAVSLIGFVGLFAGLGVTRGVKRNIAYYEDEPAKARGIVRAGITISLGSHLVVAVVLAVFAPVIAVQAFGNPDLAVLLQIAAIGLPFAAVRGLGVSVATGSRDATTHTVVNQILGPVTNSLLVAVFVVAGLGAVGAILGRTVATVLMTGLAAWLALRTFPIDLRGPSEPMARELLGFSLPLVVTAWTTFFVDETDYLVLGLFRPESAVGTYTAMFTLRPMILLFFFPATFLLSPVVTRLQKQDDFSAARETYQAVSKWTTLASLPLFLVVFLFPTVVITMTFGAAYVDGATALRVLTVSGLVTVLLGANDRVLVGVGDTRTSMYTSGVAACANVILNFLLVPPFGMVGAAAASLTAFSARNVANSALLYRRYGLVPFSSAQVRVMLLVAAVSPPVYLAFRRLAPVGLLTVTALGVAFLLLYVPVVAKMATAEAGDRRLVREVKESRDLDLSVFRRMVRRLSP